MTYALVFIGGGIGACLRYLVTTLCIRAFGSGFPVGTFVINVSGSLIMGLVAAYAASRGDPAQNLRLFMMTGILGGYTTFSAFSLESIILFERGAYGLAAFYIAGSVALSLAGLMLGLFVVRQFV